MTIASFAHRVASLLFCLVAAMQFAPFARAADVATLNAQAIALAPLAKSTAAQEFLASIKNLPTRAPREVYTDAKTRASLSPAKWNALPETERSAYTKRTHDEAFYYGTHYGTPIAYARAIEVAAQFGLASLKDARVLDIGYGAIGSMQMLAYAGAQVSAIEVDSLMPALYNQPDDQGRFVAKDGHAGTLKLFDGTFAGDAALTKNIGGNFNLIISKNTLKRGFMRPLPGRKAWVEFGVPDEAFLKALHDALAPGGIALIYNISGPFNPERPSTDGRSPFERDAYEKAGFTVRALDVNDDAPMREMGKALAWEKSFGGDLEKNLFALYTVVQRGK
jgi:SAM-dependent methyltransferase